MRTSRITLAVLAAFALAAANAQEATAPRLLVVGPIESVDPATRTVMVLGQRILLSNVGSLNVGNTLAVYGFSRTDGSIQGSVARDQGAYVAGATPIFLAGTVQSADALTGHVIVNGVKVDLTPAMVSGQVSPAIGSKLAVQGIQPVSRGVVVTDGIIGSGVATNGIIGSGASASGIIGSGASANGIIGSGAAANGIIGSGYRSTNGIIGSGASASGIIGSGAAANGIIGSGYRSTNGIIEIGRAHV